jgi:small subunit ribosomal protein S6
MSVNEYEIMLLLDPELAQERQDEIVARTRELVEKGGGTWDGQDGWGRRKLAYEIDHKDEAAYYVLFFKSAAETLDEISRILRITDGVVRHGAFRRAKASRPGGTRPPEPPPAEPSRAVAGEEYAGSSSVTPEGA